MTKNALSLFFSLSFGIISLMACTTDDNLNLAPSPTGSENDDSSATDTSSNQPPGGAMRVKIGSTTFTARLLTNATATAFKARLPITISMSELNGNEKLYRFPNNLPTNALNPGTIQTGDLMLYGSNTLVLFYQTFPTSYSYTRIGRIDNPSGLAAALGAGNVTVTFQLE